ncbi:hypothetical protein SDC9_192256 [bioreactor metagenome]|uniref:Uncharacterized protein n=1 Tax=bioreactor metagenome TaxID=1076179 RepID=A0A645I073_9ZZZZ
MRLGRLATVADEYRSIYVWVCRKAYEHVDRHFNVLFRLAAALLIIYENRARHLARNHLSRTACAHRRGHNNNVVAYADLAIRPPESV